MYNKNAITAAAEHAPCKTIRVMMALFYERHTAPRGPRANKGRSHMSDIREKKKKIVCVCVYVCVF